uniref:hypothetical protein n=1 Tax=Komagataeibacter europaeus TaxID=33995 RepID=UPI00035C251D|nr:hypothetical protein [Komagataeibacter europaeus]
MKYKIMEKFEDVFINKFSINSYSKAEIENNKILLDLVFFNLVFFEYFLKKASPKTFL